MSAAIGNGAGRVERWSQSSPCTVCGGFQAAPQHQGIRCHGYRSSDGLYFYCSREGHAGTLRPHGEGNLFAHRDNADCRCGVHHGDRDRKYVAVSLNESETTLVSHLPYPWRVPVEHIEMAHDYRLRGELLWQYCRFWKWARPLNGGAKGKPRHRGSDGNWLLGLPAEWKGRRDKPLYRQDEALRELRMGGKVFVTEGERDADALWDARCIGVCNPDCAGSFREAQAERLIRGMRDGARAAEIDIITDNDEAGIKHAKKVRQMIAIDPDLRRRVRIVRPPDGYKDAAEFLVRGDQ